MTAERPAGPSVARFAAGRKHPQRVTSAGAQPVAAPESRRRLEPGRDPVTAVILAAAPGSRLGESAKPLVRVAGITLLERAVATARAAGARRVVVVVGHAAESVTSFVASRGLDVEVVENERFSLGNGSSAAVGGRAAGERFLVLPCDRIVEAGAVAELLGSDAPFAIAVHRGRVRGDAAAATRVRLSGEEIVAIGRGLEPFDAVDTGVAVCDPAVVETAERALAAGERTWDAVKRRWMKEGRRLDAVDLSGSVWVDVSTPEDVRRAEELIVRRAGAGPSDGPVSRWVNRPLSRRLSLPLARAGVSPTAVTLAGFGLTLLAAAVVALGALWPLALVLGGLLVQLSLVVDGCDGELARATHRTSRSGAFLDSLLDRLGDIALLLALAVAAGLGTRAWAALVAALAPVLLVPYVKAAYEARMGAPFPPSRWMLGRDSRLFLIAVGAVVMQPLLTLVVIAAVSTLEAAVRIRRGVAAAARS